MDQRLNPFADPVVDDRAAREYVRNANKLITEFKAAYAATVDNEDVALKRVSNERRDALEGVLNSLRQFRPTDAVSQQCADSVADRITEIENILATKPTFADLPALDIAANVDDLPPARDGSTTGAAKTPSERRGDNPRASSRKSQSLSSTSRREMVARQNAIEERFQEDEGDLSLDKKKSDAAKRNLERKLEAERLEKERQLEAMRLEMEREFEAKKDELEIRFQTQEEKFKRRALKNAARRREGLAEISEDIESIESKSVKADSVTSKVETWNNNNANLTEETPLNTTPTPSPLDSTVGKQSNSDNIVADNPLVDSIPPPPGVATKTTSSPGDQTLGVNLPENTTSDMTSNSNQKRNPTPTSDQTSNIRENLMKLSGTTASPPRPQDPYYKTFKIPHEEGLHLPPRTIEAPAFITIGNTTYVPGTPFVVQPTATTTNVTWSNQSYTYPTYYQPKDPPIHQPEPPKSSVHTAQTSTDKVAVSQQALLAHQLMSQNRPPKDKVFTGLDKRIDFESHVQEFHQVTQIEGSNPTMIALELKHWFGGPAGIIVKNYSNGTNAQENIDRTLTQLKAEYGRRKDTARKMLDDTLTGPQINAKDHKALQTFIFHLQNAHLRSIETNREATFNTSDTYNTVLNKKLPSLISRWAVESQKHEDRFLRDGQDIPDITFKDFLAFLKTQYRIAERKAEISDQSAAAAKTAGGQTPNGKSIGGNGSQSFHRNGHKKTTARIVAVNPEADEDDSEECDEEIDTEVVAAAAAAAAAPKRQHMKPKTGPRNDKRPGKPEGKNPSDPPSCQVCNGKEQHCLDQCKSFIDSDKKFILCFSKGYCYRCLCKGHMASSCPSDQTCSVCGKRHHDLLHGAERPEGKPSVEKK